MEHSNLIKRVWDKISFIGIADKYSNLEKRSIILINRINFVMLVTMFFLFIATNIYVLRKGWGVNYGLYRILFVFLLSVVIIIVNAKKHFWFSKLALSTVPAFLIIVLPALLGITYTSSFFYYQIALLGFSIVPHLFYTPTRKNHAYLIIIFFYFLSILFIDDLMVFSIKKDFEIVEIIGSLRFLYKLVPVTVFMFVHLALYYLRKTNLDYELRLGLYIKKLNKANLDLKCNNETIKEQKEEIETVLNKLRETQQRLIQTEKMTSLGTFAAGVAHEINNPLNYINGAITGLKNYFYEKQLIDNDINALLKFVDEGVNRIIYIVNGLGEFSRNGEDLTEDCNIHSILENCIVMLHHKLGKNISMIRNYSKENIFLKGNIGKLHHVFTNILLNSILSIEEKGSITIETQKTIKSVSVAFVDNGSGIEKGDIPRVVDPFFTTRPPGEGTGLGLSTSYSYIKEHNGEMKFDSEKGKGTKVTITFPIM